ncbi:MAG: hypothetical protein ABR616_16240 [Dermatophilaceae bacterium]
MSGAVVAALLLAPTAHAEAEDGLTSKDGRLAQQQSIQEFADRTDRDAAHIEARLRSEGVPDDIAIQLDEMQLVDRSEVGIQLDEMQPVEGSEVDLIEQESNDATLLNDPVVPGSCGFSYVFINDVGPLLYGIETGFSIDPPQTAVGYSWKVQVTNPFGFSRNHRWGGGLANRTNWDGVRVDDAPLATVYTASASGWAAINGTSLLCYSAGPVDSRFIN